MTPNSIAKVMAAFVLWFRSDWCGIYKVRSRILVVFSNKPCQKFNICFTYLFFLHDVKNDKLNSNMMHLVFFVREKVTIIYPEILTRIVDLWSLFTSETSENIHKSTFQV